MTKKIKVVFAIGHFGIGGAERVTVELLNNFDHERFECHLITLLQNPEKNFLHDVQGDVSVHQFAFTGFSDVHSWWRLYRALTELKPDVVISSLFFSNTVFRVLKSFMGFVVITCEHNTDGWKTWLQRAFDRALAHFSYRIVAVSNTVAQFTATHDGIPREKFVVIPNGVDREKIQTVLAALPPKDILKQEFGFDISDKILVNVARLTEQKNHKLLLEGFALFHKTHPEYKLAIVGEGALRTELEAYTSALGLEEAVTFFGIRRDIEKFYKLSDALVLTSDFEGFAIVGIEAMASGLPMISTRTAGPDEYLKDGENGFFIHERTPAGVAKSLEELRAADLAILSTHALHTAEQFAVGSNVEQYEHVILQAVQ